MDTKPPPPAPSPAFLACSMTTAPAGAAHDQSAAAAGSASAGPKCQTSPAPAARTTRPPGRRPSAPLRAIHASRSGDLPDCRSHPRRRPVRRATQSGSVLIDVNDVALGHETKMRWNDQGTWIWSEQMTHPLVIDADITRAYRRRGLRSPTMQEEARASDSEPKARKYNQLVSVRGATPATDGET